MSNNSQVPTILSIETSCDETAVAVTHGTQVLSNAVYSQLDLHAQYGGVVPSIAKLAHEEKFDDVLNTALESAGMPLDAIDTISVTVGPGLAIALEVGIARAKRLATELKKPLIAVNHMHGHLVSGFANQELSKAQFPALGLLVSGGHTEFIYINNWNDYTKIGETLDDACGEAFDKCAHLLGLPYPGGPAVSKLADSAYPNLEISYQRQHQSLIQSVKDKQSGVVLELPIPMASSPELDVSYSGLKTAVKNLVAQAANLSDKQNIADLAHEVNEGNSLTDDAKAHIAAAFQSAAFKMLLLKLELAVTKHNDIKQLWLGGGVIANNYFQDQVTVFAQEHNLELVIPSREFITDNAAMIGLAAYISWRDGLNTYTNPADFEMLDRQPNLSL